ncbi:MAG: cellulose binding domain-containing protein [Deltaproteobacteria bacterium]|nr:cellulose binding domain-containing protein [Deltaproteobacteria bacterium]
MSTRLRFGTSLAAGMLFLGASCVGIMGSDEPEFDVELLEGARCSVTYSPSTAWSNGDGTGGAVVSVSFSASVPLNGWAVTWAFPGTQKISSLWDGQLSQVGHEVKVVNASWNRSLASGARMEFGFVLRFQGEHVAPTQFSLNGLECNGSQPPSPPSPPSSSSPCPGPVPDGYTFIAGQSDFGRNSYIEYLPGDLPIIISAPHGGYLAPDEIPAQPGAVRDGGSQEYARLVYEYLVKRTGKRPHLVINHLTRNRLQANSNRDVSTAGNKYAGIAWDEYHAYLRAATSWVASACGKGHYFDLHTNGHAEGWVELGMAISSAQLNLADQALDVQSIRDNATIRSLASRGGASFVELVRGPTSLGGLLDAAGIKVVPSPTFAGPGDGGFFNGGFNVRQYGSRNGGVVDSTQIESHFSYVNAGRQAREAYADKLTTAIISFVETHYGFNLDIR